MGLLLWQILIILSLHGPAFFLWIETLVDVRFMSLDIGLAN